MEAIADAIDSGQLADCRIAVVISDRNCHALKLAKQRGFPAKQIRPAPYNATSYGNPIYAYEERMQKELVRHDVNLICLAGYMRILRATFVSGWGFKIINIHPSLLPSFPGQGAQAQAIQHGVKVSGCTVHFVDATLDGGPIIAQRVVPVLDGDTEAELSARILEEEHRLYPETIARVLERKWTCMDGRRIVFQN
jgi:phosphoribosylglycinamide formyltransferase-1